ncbi:VasL domain-containing protein [Klebsiella aerogenes]
MQVAQHREVKTGSDPRNLPDFTTLREEMGKLTHPARPDIDWRKVENLSLSLFEINGVELQTGAWYTLARIHLARINGMNQGLAILIALLSHQWVQLWPEPVHARVEIINDLLQHLQKLFCTIPLGGVDKSDLTLAEIRLLELQDILRRQNLDHVCQMNSLIQLIRSALSQRESNLQPEDEPVEARKAEQVAEKQRVPPKRWPAFMAGMATALALSSIVIFVRQASHPPNTAILPMAASVAWIPQAMTPAQIEAFRGTENSRTHAGMWLARISSQINWIMNLAPGWRLRYGQGLLVQAQMLWPDEPATQTLVQRWEQYQAGRTLPASQLSGWHEGMMQLRALSEQLDALDRQKGKYPTVSELKKSIWRITSTFASSVPVEEELRQLVSAPEEVNAPQANAEQTARHLDSLIHVLEQLSVPGGEHIASDKVLPASALQAQIGGQKTNSHQG